MLSRDKVQELITHMPESFSVDDLVEKVILLQKIGKAEEEIRLGEGIEWDDLKREMDSWLE